MFEAAADPPPEGDDHPADGPEVRGVEESVVEAVRGLASVLEIDPEDLSGGERGELVAALASVAGRVDAALCRAVGSFAAHGDHTGDGARSAGSWIAARTELSATAARDLAHRGVVLRDCPGVTEAYGEPPPCATGDEPGEAEPAGAIIDPGRTLFRTWRER